MYSTTPENGYDHTQGTSFSAPVVSGVAAVLRSYFPDLTARQGKEILLMSATPQNIKVNKPGTEDKISFRQLSVTGGVVNTYNAVKMAELVKGKKKMKKGDRVGNGKSSGEKMNTGKPGVAR